MDPNEKRDSNILSKMPFPAYKFHFSKIASIIRENCYPVGLGLFLYPLLCIVLVVIGFIANIPITKWHTLVGTLLTYPVIYISTGKKTGRAIACYGTFLLAILLLVILFSLPFYDEGDGVAYHKPAVIMMADGWNPIWNYENTKPFDRDIQAIEGRGPYVRTAVLYFPKAQWIFATLVYQVTGNIDVGSYINGLYGIISLIIVYWSLAVLFSLSRLERLLAALVIAGNPIVIIQLTSGMIDSLMGSLLTILIVSFASYAKTHDNRFLPFIAGSIPLACNIKFTGIVYVAITILLLTIFICLDAHRNFIPLDRRFKVIITFSLFITFLVGINPYLLNIVKYANPFHPFLAVGSTDPLKAEFIDPPDAIFHETNQIQRCVTSYLLAQPRTICGPKFKAFEIFPREVLFGGYTTTDLVYAEICGFGPLFAIGLGTSLVLIFFVTHRFAWWMLIVVGATILAQPHAYIGRYVPQLWLVPPIVLCAIRSQSLKPCTSEIRIRLLYWLIMGILFIGCLKVSKAHLIKVINRTQDEIYAVRLINKNPFLKIGESLSQEGSRFYQIRIAHDCLISSPNINSIDSVKSGKKIVAFLRYAPVFLIYDANNPTPNQANLVPIKPRSVIIDLLELRQKQFKKAWGI